MEYLFLDGVCESPWRQAGVKEGVLVARGVCRDGSRVLLHVALGHKESYGARLDFPRDLVRGGLNVPLLVVTDGAPGLIRAVEEEWPMSLRQRCLATHHRSIRTTNLLEGAFGEQKRRTKIIPRFLTRGRA